MTTRRERDEQRKDALQGAGFYDIEQADTTGAAECELFLPDGRPMMYADDEGVEKQAAITVYGADSETYRRTADELQEKAMKGGRRARALTVGEAREQARELAARCTFAWRGIGWKNGAGPIAQECSLRNARFLYERSPFIYEQVERFMHERVNFFEELAAVVIDFARGEFELNRPMGKSGPTLGAHLREAERRTGKRDPRLEIDPLPPEGKRIWQWFSELHRTRDAGLAAGPITYREIGEWSRLTGRKPKPWEVATIVAIDLEWRSADAAARKQEEPQ